MAQAGYFGSWLVSRDLPNARLVEAQYGPGERIPEHSHDSPYLCLILKGAYRERTRGVSHLCRTGMTIFHPPGERHSDEFEGGTCARLFMIEPTAGWMEGRSVQGSCLERRFTCHGGAISQTAQRVYREAILADQYSPLAIEGLLLELAALMMRSSQPGNTPPGWLRRIRQRLRDEYSGRLTLGELAAAEGVSPSELAHAFRRYGGRTAGEELRCIRVEMAARRLRETKMSLAAIAVDCGFASQSHFSTSFRRITGYTPLEYRKYTQ